jgi:pimeloyl-ACP methyl ester carboxylesterase
LLPRGQLHVIPGGGHLFMTLQAEHTADAIDKFIEAAATSSDSSLR